MLLRSNTAKPSNAAIALAFGLAFGEYVIYLAGSVQVAALVQHEVFQHAKAVHDDWS